MNTIAISGNDTINIGGTVLHDLADGDVGELTYPNEIAAVKTGKNGNSIYSFNATGLQCDLKVRVIRGSSDDKFLNSIVQAFVNNPAGFVLLDSNVVKRIGNGTGNIANDSYLLQGGVPTKQPGATSNVEGSTDQSVAIYEFKYTNAPRRIL